MEDISHPCEMEFGEHGTTAVESYPRQDNPIDYTQLTGDQKLELLLQKADSTQNEVRENSKTIKRLSNLVDSEFLNLKRRVTYVEAENETLKQTFRVIKSKQENTEERVAWLESEEYKCRIQLLNVPEEKTGKENTKDRVKTILTNLGIDYTARLIRYAFREGKYNPGNCRSILIRFDHPDDRHTVWSKRNDLVAPVRCRQVFPEQIAMKRRVLQQIVNVARDMAHYKDKVYLKQDKLIICGISYTIESLNELPADIQILVGCTMKDDIVYFYGGGSPFSSHYPCEIKIGNMVFTSAEQGFFYSKACLYKDSAKAAQILAATTPQMCKRIGGSFGTKDWGKASTPLTVMTSLVREKFSQNPYLQRMLLATDAKELAEANPYDHYWAIGSSAKDAIAKNHRWTGNNTLGTILVDVRSDIRNAMNAAAT